LEARAVAVELDPEGLSAVVGKGGAAIKALRESAAGVVIDVDWGAGVVRLFGEDDDAVEAVRAALEAVAEANHHRVVHLGREPAMALRGARGAAMRTAITGPVDDPDESKRGLGVTMDVQPESNGRVRLRGSELALTAAAELLAAFAAENVAVEMDVMPDDSAVLNGGGDAGLLKRAAADFGVEARFLRERAAVRLLGTAEATRDAANWLQRQLFGGGGGEDDDGTVVLMALDAASMGPVIGRGGANIQKLEAEHGVGIDALSARNCLRLRGEAKAVSAARAALLRFVSETRVTAVVSVQEGQAWPTAYQLRTIGEQCGVTVEPKRFGGGGGGDDRRARDSSEGSGGSGGDRRNANNGGRSATNGAGRGYGGGPKGGAPRRGREGEDHRGNDGRENGGGGGGRGEIRIRGVIGDVDEAKARMTELVTGRGGAEIRLEPSHVAELAALGAATGLLWEGLGSRAALLVPPDEILAVSVSLDGGGRALVLEGPTAAVAVARQYAFAALGSFFPGQFVEVPARRGGAAASAAVTATVVDRVRASTGAVLSVDRRCSCVRVRASTAAAAADAAAAVADVLIAWEERNAVVAFDAWMTPMIIAKGGSGLRALVAAGEGEAGSGGARGINFDVDRDAGICRISAADPAALNRAVAALEEKIHQLRRENVEVPIPFEAIGSFIGRGGANINRLREETGANFDLDKRDRRLWVRGSDSAVAAGVAAAEQFLQQWRAENEVDEVVHLGVKAAAALATTAGATALAGVQSMLAPGAA
ncbi:unnamed protein product, partial [Phaeothamnion confervicola]